MEHDGVDGADRASDEPLGAQRAVRCDPTIDHLHQLIAVAAMLTQHACHHVTGRPSSYAVYLLPTREPSAAPLRKVDDGDGLHSMKNMFAAYQRPRLFVLETMGDILETGGPRLPPFADREQHERCLQWADLYYEQPVCRRCLRPTSRRSAQRLCVEALYDRHDGAGVHIGNLAPRLSLVLSARFLAALTVEEKAMLQLLPVDAPKSREGFSEVVGPDQVRSVALTSVAPSGWSCLTCGRARWAYWVPGSRIRTFVRTDVLPTPAQGMFVLRDAENHHLVVTAERFATLRRAKVTRGLQGIPLGVLPAELATDSPELPEVEAPRYFEVSE